MLFCVQLSNDGWMVLADPEGGEFCAFVRDPEQLAHHLRLYELVIDSADPGRIAGWWAERFGVEVQHGTEDSFCWIADGPGMPWAMVFGRVPEPKTAKNRVHGRHSAANPRRRDRLGCPRRPGRQRVLRFRP